jgi:hypothetical protein
MTFFLIWALSGMIGGPLVWVARYDLTFGGLFSMVVTGWWMGPFLPFFIWFIGRPQKKIILAHAINPRRMPDDA